MVDDPQAPARTLPRMPPPQGAGRKPRVDKGVKRGPKRGRRKIVDRMELLLLDLYRLHKALKR